MQFSKYLLLVELSCSLPLGWGTTVDRLHVANEATSPDIVVSYSVIMCTHAVNITLPWTLGVFMIRDFMGISRGGPSGMGEEGMFTSPQAGPPGLLDAATPLPSFAEMPSVAPMVVPAASSADALVPEAQDADSITSPGTTHDSSDDKRAQLEHLVGFRAGILSAAFSFSQVTGPSIQLQFGPS